MIDYKPTLVNELNTLLGNTAQETKVPVVAENFATKDITFPCVSYNLSNDLVRANGDEFGYSDMYFNIKVWGYSMADMEPIASKIDTKMRTLGFTRIATTELWYQGLGQKELRYQGLAREIFN